MESQLLRAMFIHERIEQTIDKCVKKGINKAELRELKKAEQLAKLYFEILNGTKEFVPGHQGAIPKNDGTGDMRIVYIGETPERFISSLTNDCLFELLPQLVHPSTKAYQKGLSTQKAVKEFAHKWGKNYGRYKIVKSDYHHYFDDILKEKVFEMLDKIERELGFEPNTEPVINLLRKMYSNDYLFDVDGNLIEKWSGIRQGNACGSFMADAILYDVDDYMYKKYPYYVRYSDDSIIMSDNPDEVKSDLRELIKPFGVTINEKKFEVVTDEFIKFLGFNVNGYNITLSKSRWKDLEDEIFESVKNCHSAQSAMNKIYKVLYKGNGKYSWATSCLSTINVTKDLITLDTWLCDLIRIASYNKGTMKKSDVGGLGVEMNHKDYTLVRGKGSKVREARKKMYRVPDYITVGCMCNNIRTSKSVFETLVRTL